MISITPLEFIDYIAIFLASNMLAILLRISLLVSNDYQLPSYDNHN